MKRFVLDPIDILQVSRPYVSDIDVAETAAVARKELGGKSHRSYNSVFAQMKSICSGRAELDNLLDIVIPEKQKTLHQKGWNRSVRYVTTELHRIYGRHESTWYASARKPVEVLPGTWFKNAIRGVRVFEGNPKAILVNPRKKVFFNTEDLAFLSRWLIEFHLRDDSNLSGFEVVDLGENPRTERRQSRRFSEEHLEPMALEKFEVALERFVDCLQRAGFVSAPSPANNVADLFRRLWQ